jgi:matrixin/carboxypeptidase family protein
MRKPVVAGVTAFVVLACWAADAGAYLKLGTRIRGEIVSLKWGTLPIHYFVTNRDVPGVTAPQLQDAIARAFTTWAAAPDVHLGAEFAGFTSVSPLQNTSQTVLGFADRPDLDRVLGSTSFTVDMVSGEIVEADVFFNSTFPWSTAPAGETGHYDVESIALHEIGHLHGLGHSALGETELRADGRRVLASEAVMFPIAFSPGSIDQRTLHADDIAGISDIYSNTTIEQRTGSITGRVTKNGTGVPGAHVIAYSPGSGKLVAGFTLAEDGSFVIAALDPGVYVLRVEPLDDADTDSFFDASMRVDMDFRPAFSPQLVIVPRGGTSRGVEIKVVAK